MTVPVVDISGDSRWVAGEIGAACRDLGSLTVTGQRVPEDMVERTGQVARTVFDLPDREERTLAEGLAKPGLRVALEEYFASFSGLGERLRRPGRAAADHPPRYELVAALEHVRAKAAKALA